MKRVRPDSLRILLTADPEIPVPPRLYGGIERIVDALLRGLMERGHTVALLAHRESRPPTEVPLFPWPAAGGMMRHGAALRDAVRQFRPEVVHSFSRLLYLLPVLRQRVAKIMSFQRQPTPRTVRWATRLAQSGTLRFTGCSEFISRQGRAAGGVWEAVPNFVDTNRFEFVPEVLPDAPLVFLGRLDREKGAHTAIAACRQTGRRLFLAGNRADSAVGQRYWDEEIAPQLRSGHIEYVGPVDDTAKIALLRQAAAMISPVEWDEPFGIVFAEALACGTPVIASPRGALPEIVRPGVDGFLVRSAEEAAAMIPRLQELRRADCRERAEQCFSTQVVVARYESLYQTIKATCDQVNQR